MLLLLLLTMGASDRKDRRGAAEASIGMRAGARFEGAAGGQRRGAHLLNFEGRLAGQSSSSRRACSNGHSRRTSRRLPETGMASHCQAHQALRSKCRDDAK